MATIPAGHIGADQAAQLLRMPPAELTRLAGEGVIPRHSPGVYHPGAIIAAYIEHLKAEPDRRGRAPTQAEIAAHLGTSDRTVREILAKLGLDHKAVPLAEIRLKYIEWLREQAAGRQSADGELDLVQERAKLAKKQSERLDIQNAVLLGTYAPIGLLTEVLATASQSVVDRLNHIPATLKLRCPELPAAARDVVLDLVAEARNEWVRKTTRLLEEELGEGDRPIEDQDDPQPVADADEEDLAP